MKSILRHRRGDAVLIACGGFRSTTTITSVSLRSTFGQEKQRLHTTATKEHPIALDSSVHTSVLQSSSTSSPRSQDGLTKASPLSVLPLSQVLRSWLITGMSSRPRLLGITTRILQRMLESQNPIFSVERNPILRGILWHTFYKQFCSGETPRQVAEECRQFRQQGYAGIVLEYSLEVLKDAESNEVEDIAIWRKGLLDTIDTVTEGDFVGLKWSGMGAAAMRLMVKNEAPNKRMQEAMDAVCDAAAAKGVSLLPAAEETWTLDGFNQWSLDMQKRYNVDGRCVVYNTYQCYLKRTPGTLQRHLEEAGRDGYTIGVKLVRGAYLGTEQRSHIWDSIEETHLSYDSLASAVLLKKGNDFVSPSSWPDLKVVLATHNAESVEKAQKLRQKQADRGESLVPLAFAQLQGMADEVSCNLIAAARASESNPKVVKENVFKYTTWGPMIDCLGYLLRRAAENKDAAGRTYETRNAMRAELWRRIKAAFGLA